MIKWLRFLAPYPCLICGKLGSSLGDCCKDYIKKKYDTWQSEAWVYQNLQAPIERQKIEWPFGRVFCLGDRQEELKTILNAYKFDLRRDLAEDLASLAVDLLPKRGYKLVPIPTLNSHVRQRGFDHTLLLVKKLAKQTGWPVANVLRRTSRRQKSQVGLSKKERQLNMNKAFRAKVQLDPNLKYLIVDDIWTTGATALAAAEALQQAGAKQIDLLVFARQPYQAKNSQK